MGSEAASGSGGRIFMKREDLVVLVSRIMAAQFATEAEHLQAVDLLCRAVVHPHVTDLIYHDRRALTAEQIVDEAINYKPIAL